MLNPSLPARLVSFDRPLGMTLVGAGVSALMLLPLGYILYYAAQGGEAGWARVWSTLLPRLLANTVALGAAVALVTLLVGGSLAWVVTRYDFFGRRMWSWLLATPLGVPPYILAYVYTEQFLPGGWAQQAAQALMGPSARLPLLYGSFPAVVMVMSLATYPYVYLMVRASLINHNVTFEEAARIQGVSRAGRFLRITLPLHRPAVTAGLFMVVMYVFADFGAVSMMRYSTFTRAIYLELAGRSDYVGASMLCVALIALSGGLLWMERRSRSRGRFYLTGGAFRPVRPVRCGIRRSLVIWAYFLSVLGASSGITIAFLVAKSVEGFRAEGAPEGLWGYAFNTVLVSGTAATAAVLLIFPVAYLATRYRDVLYQAYLRFSYAGYVLPGPIIGVGVLFMALHLFEPLYGTVATLMLAYLIRFLPQGLQAMESSFHQVKPHLEEAARSMGSGFHAALLRVVIPLVKPGLITGWVLIFVSSVKELPATLLLRPLGFDTLAVRIWIETSEEFYTLAAPAALLLIGVTFPLYAFGLSRTSRDSLP